MSSTFLAEKLIAREGQQLKTFASQLVVHVGQLFIVGRCQSSLACHIDNQNGFLAFVPLEVDQVSFDIFDLEIKERLSSLIRKGFSATLMNKSLCYCTHQYIIKDFSQLVLVMGSSALIKMMQSEIGLDTTNNISLSFQDYSYFGVFHIKTSFPVVQNLILFLIQSQFAVFIQILLIVRHFCQIYRCIVTSKSMIATARFIERRASYVINLSLESYICFFIFDSIELAKLLECEISLDDFFGRDGVEGDFFFRLVDKPEYCYNGYDCDYEPLTHLLIKILNITPLPQIFPLSKITTTRYISAYDCAVNLSESMQKCVHLVFIKYNLYLY